MQISLAAPNTLRLTFAYNKQTIGQVKTIPGRIYDEKTKTWLAPVNQLARCEELFPKAQFAYAAFAAESDAMRVSAAQLHAMLTRNGATFHVSESDIVLVEGEHVSPLVQEVVRERSRWLAPLLTCK